MSLCKFSWFLSRDFLHKKKKKQTNLQKGKKNAMRVTAIWEMQI